MSRHAFRVATFGALSEICFFRALIVADSLRGASPDCSRANFACFEVDTP